jgi:hypothetical protein
MSSMNIPFISNTSPLIKITSFGEVSYFNTKADKLQALRDRKETEKFVIAWGGKWRTDVFEVTEEDIEDILIRY